MSAELLALLRYRIASRYYDQPAVLDQIARAILRERASEAHRAGTSRAPSRSL